jgi:superfamily II DNA or RNA helicase
MELYEFQNELTYNIAVAIYNKNRAIMAQSPTGSGKTVIFSNIVDRYNKKSNNRVLILVHRVEILNQTINTLREWHGIEAQAITADTRTVYDRLCYVAMVETAYRRIIKRPNFLPSLGMVIIDERHIGNFNKIHSFYQQEIIIGFSATPLASNKKEPLNKYFDTIVCGPQINELIACGALVQNHTYSVKGVRRSALKIKAGEFDEKFMGDEFSKLRNVKNTIISYQSISHDTKAICYNCNIEHSKIMNRAWIDAGYQSRHVDGETPEDERAEIFAWFKVTPKAILNNVGVATMGYDEPSIQTVIVNRATTSPVLSIQMGGRGSRPFEGKDFFTILDMGGNYRNDAHGDWNSDRDWSSVFHNPPKGREKLGAQPVKECPNCMGIIPLNISICPLCGYELPKAVVFYDTKNIQLELITKNINVAELIEKNIHYKDFYTLCQIGYKIGAFIKHKTKGNITDEIVNKAVHEVMIKAEEWSTLKKRPFDRTVKWLAKKSLIDAMGYNPNKTKNSTNVQSIENI